MKFLNYLKENKLFAAFLIVLVIFIIFMLIIVSRVVGGSNVSEYGDRLKGIEKVKITEKQQKKLVKEMKANDKVSDAEFDIQHNKKVDSRRVDILLTFKDADINEAKEIGNKVLDYFTEEQKKYYDIEVFLDSKEKKEGFPSIGYKHKSRDAIAWE